MVKYRLLIVGAIALILLLNLATAEELICDDFPEEKEEDCLEIIEQGLDEEDEEAVLELLLDYSEEDSDYVWQFEEYDFTDEYETSSRIVSIIEADRLLFAWNIFILGFVNYFVFSIVTKTSNIKKWLNVA